MNADEHRQTTKRHSFVANRSKRIKTRKSEQTAHSNARARTRMTRPEEWDRFFEKLEERGNVSDSCKASGVGRTTVYERLDGKFPAETTEEEKKAWRARYDDALRGAMDRLESEAFRRAHDGVEEPIIGRVGKDEDGVLTDKEGHQLKIRKYSDTLMVLLLKAHRPEKYKDRVASELSGPGGKPIQTESKVICLPVIDESQPE